MTAFRASVLYFAGVDVEIFFVIDKEQIPTSGTVVEMVEKRFGKYCRGCLGGFS